MRNGNYDLIVVGGGILGTFHAYHAAQRGLKVIILEKDDEAKGASVQNFGQVVPSGLDSSWQKYGIESLKIYKELAEKYTLPLEENGSFYLASNEEEYKLLEELNQLNSKSGYPSQLLNKQECEIKLPALNKGYSKGGLFFPQELSVNPRKFIHALHKQFVSDKLLEISFGKLVLSIERNSKGVKVKTGDGQIFQAKKAILCNGKDFQTLFPEAFQQSDLEIVKLQMLRLFPQNKVHLKGNILTGLSIRRYESFMECTSYKSIKNLERANTFHKQWGIHILFKQENDGSIILGDSHEYLSASSKQTFNHVLNERITKYFIQEGQKIMDLEHWEIESTWNGFYAQSKGEDRIYNKEILPNIHIVTGIGGKGMTASPGYSFYNINKIYHD